MGTQAAIVVTTIFEPLFLRGYLDSLRKYRHEGTSLTIVPDRKTPPSVYAAASQACDQGFDVRCPAEEEQVEFLRRLALPDDFIPWNTDNRRNVGYLMALDAGCDVLISIDDDNFCRPDVDFVGEHGCVGTEVRSQRSEARGRELPRQNTRNTQHATRWLNVCSMLETDCPVEIYPRGFPYFARGDEALAAEDAEGAGGTVAINAGLWLGDPDVDAVTRLSLAPKVTASRGPSMILGANVWTPINTQNTALTREAATAYYYVRMGYPLQGSKIDRYGDILSGYFAQKCARHLGHTIRVGTPVADHRRTPHNLFKDLHQEMAGMVIVEDLVPWLIEEPLEGSTYVEAYASLAERLAASASGFRGAVWDQGGRGFLIATAKLMRTWLKAMECVAC